MDIISSSEAVGELASSLSKILWASQWRRSKHYMINLAEEI